jgi:hypothetical protein
MDIRLDVTMLPQPDDSSCGPTCLHAVYDYYGLRRPLPEIISEIECLDKGGTLGVVLANHALGSGFNVTLCTYNLMIFDPTWFNRGVNLAERLRKRFACTGSRKQRFAIKQYLQFLAGGGTIKFEDMTRRLLTGFLEKNIPIITGLNSTFLYRSSRVFTETMRDDDIRGRVEGHFVVLSGYERSSRVVAIADPYSRNPFTGNTSYRIGIDRVINAILLGVMTYDANFIIIEPQPT